MLVEDYSKDFCKDQEPVRRSIINSSHRATYCCVFWSRFYLKILVGREKSKTKIINENALEYLASWDDLKMDRIGDARNLKQNHDENLKLWIVI